MLLQTLPSLEKESQAIALLVLVVCAAALGTQMRSQGDRDTALYYQPCCQPAMLMQEMQVPRL